MTAKICFFLACTTFTIWCYTCCIVEISDVSDVPKIWSKLDPAAQIETVQFFVEERKKTEYDRFICAASLIRRIGEALYEEVIEHLKIVFAFENKYKPYHRGEPWFQREFNNWRIRTYQPINKKIHQAILRICPKEKKEIVKIHQREYLDFIQRGGSQLAQNLRELIRSERKRKYVAAMIPSSYYKMCTYLHEESSLALSMYENRTVNSIFDALMTYNYWRFSLRDIRYLNMILLVLKKDFRLEAKRTKHNYIAFPVASFKTGCDW